MTDGIKMLNENLIKLTSGGKTFTERYCDILKPPNKDERTADDIINGIKAKLKGDGEK